MKKLIAFLLAFAVTAPTALAADNFYTYNKYIYNDVKPNTGVCNIDASFVGYESTFSDVNDYFTGLISAVNADLNGDGADELITVESKAINIYTIQDNSVTLCGTINERLIGNSGDSYANIFLKNYNGVNYLGVELFFAGSGQNRYQIELYTLNGTELTSKAYVYQLAGTNELYQSIKKDGVSIFSHTNGNGIVSTMDPYNFSSVYMAAKDALYGAGIIDDFLNRTDKLQYRPESYDQPHKLSNYVNDITLLTYIRGTGVRTSQKPVVVFYDYSRLNELIQPAYTIKVKLNGYELAFADQEPIIKDGRTLVPVRAIFEALGADVSWLPSSQKVIANTADTNITMTIGSQTYFVNGQAKYLDVPPMIINDRTLVPARASAEGFGCRVTWDDSTKTVLITQ